MSTALTTHEHPLVAHVPERHIPSASVALFDADTFGQMQRIAQAMGTSSLCPAHLKGKTQQETIGNCIRVVNQAYRWNMDPFACADESYVVHGKLGYQGKLVAAVVNARAGLVGRLKYTVTGSGDAMKCTVSGHFIEDEEPSEATLAVKQAKTDNTMWTTDPEQKLIYSATTRWARRFCPELMMGVLTDNDLEKLRMRDCSAPSSGLAGLRDKLTQEPEAARPISLARIQTDVAEREWTNHVYDQMSKCGTALEAQAVRQELLAEALDDEERRTTVNMTFDALKDEGRF